MDFYASYAKRILDKFECGIKVYKAKIKLASTDSCSVLHLGCGHDLNGIYKLMPSRALLNGIDVDRNALESYPCNAWLGDAAQMPFKDSSFDLVVSEYVLEHLEDPQNVFREVNRVLADGGLFLSLAPNFLSYKSWIAHFTPHWFHKFVVKFLRPGSRADNDVYPTVFRANTRTALERVAREEGFEIECFEYINNGPTWFQRLPLVFEIGLLFHLALRVSFLAPLRCNILIGVRKEGGGGRHPHFGVNCIKCKAPSMEKQLDAYVCSKCRHVYPLQSGIVHAT